MAGKTNCYDSSAIISNYETTCLVKVHDGYIRDRWATIGFPNCEG